MLTKQQLEVILEKLIKIYKSVYEENIQRIILYGSYARGDYSATLMSISLPWWMEKEKHCSKN